MDKSIGGRIVNSKAAQLFFYVASLCFAFLRYETCMDCLSTETIAVELKIRLNCQMGCNEFLKFVQ